ncbi:ESPR domain-containing protein [Acinetobacter kanungonis]|nr:ESPR domain-containing protein [Acinetobacter kanungonis]
MNKVYKLVWNAVLGYWVAVSETAKGKKNLRSIKSLKHQP